MNQIKQYLASLTSRERVMVIVGSIVVVVAAVYGLIFAPLSVTVAKKQSTLQDNKQTLHWMEEVFDKYHNVKTPEVLSNDKLLAVISNQLKNSKLADFNYQLEQTANGEIRINFKQVAYNDFVVWLYQLCGKYGLAVKQFSIVNKKAAGIASASVVLSQQFILRCFVHYSRI